MGDREIYRMCFRYKRAKQPNIDMEVMENVVANDQTLGLEGGEHLAAQDIEHPHSTSYRQRAHTRNERERAKSPIQKQPQNSSSSKPKLSRVRSFYTPYMEEKLLRRLKFFFMGPHEKVTARRKCPWKLIVQILKIVLVTVQLIQFGYSRSSFVEFTEKSNIALSHFYLKDWDSTYETLPYPPAIGQYAVYDIDDVEKHVNFAMKKYDKTESNAIGTLRFYRDINGTVIPMQMCMHQYTSGVIDDINKTYSIDSNIENVCKNVSSLADGSYNVSVYLNQTYNMTIDYDRLLIMELKFSLKLFRLEMKQRSFPPQLFNMDVSIKLDDSNKDGQMLVKLTTDFSDIQDFKGNSNNDDMQRQQKIGYILLDSFVICVSSLSVVLCFRSVWRALALRRETNQFFIARHGRSMKMADQCEFLNLWYVTIIINDALTLVGSGYKIQLESRNLKSSSANYDYCGLMLGTGSLLAWLGVLRYIGFFQQFNILIVTLKKAFPNMMRFLACCLMLYIGFVICGWVVLGPYHIKFRQMSTASECLFALINGDDMFTTFSATITDNELVWYYSRIYLYFFISLFIYAVLNLFIAVIMDTYETIKEYYEFGFPKSELFKLIDQCEEPAKSPLYRREDDSCSCGLIAALCTCCCRPNPGGLNDYTQIQ
ncbi:mucolipin-3-like isoform X3 [Dreissena polymorpha]|uniref:mucolipin-3-like isoform X3 n=1 Tax=Dreissena polymorpha TaxID=45954 RepID=UPI0022643C3D|nr:mucolipin-3-like isoform X3 [Dreissena polymorpha]XP_052279219.1 mucolipin-3-like isoform X3 [Dreissena polymorpha]